jgi:hypothetical protein
MNDLVQPRAAPTPLITANIPTRNRAASLPIALDSIYAQRGAGRYVAFLDDDDVWGETIGRELLGGSNATSWLKVGGHW